MSPFEYVFQYHNFVVSDPRLGLNFQTTITGYDNTQAVAGGGELTKVLWELSRKYFRSGQIPQVFNIPNEPRIDPNQHFSKGSLNRAFRSRGSPYEFYHAVRLAYLAGRCNAPGTPSAAAYCSKWFTNDCVSFAGNYTGVSSATPVFAYAWGFTAKQKKEPNFPCVHLSEDIVQIPPRRRMEDISQGDLVLTFGKPDSRGLQWRHIAVVESFTPLTSNEGLLSIAEWGWNIAKDHTVRNSKVTLHNGSKAADPSLYGDLKVASQRFLGGAQEVLCFNGKAPGKPPSPALRIFFDASKFAEMESRGWLVAGKPAPY